MTNERTNGFTLNEEELAHASGGASDYPAMRATCLECGLEHSRTVGRNPADHQRSP